MWEKRSEEGRGERGREREREGGKRERIKSQKGNDVKDIPKETIEV